MDHGERQPGREKDSMSSTGCSSSGCLVEAVAWIVELVASLLIITIAIFRGEILPAAELADKKASRTREQIDKEVKPVIDEVDRQCRDRTVYMIGPEKAKRLAELEWFDLDLPWEKRDAIEITWLGAARE